MTMLAAGSAAVFALACSDDSDVVGPPVDSSTVVLATQSVTPALIKNVMSGVSVYPLISSEDVLSGSPNYVFGGSADGAGVIKNADGTFTMVVNNEDNFSVSRITLDKTFKPTKGEYILTSDKALYRLCSATLATVSEHGFGPLFITAGESSIESSIYALDPTGGTNTAKALTALGHWSSENALPLPKQAYAGKTVVIIGDDDSGTGGGQVGMYVGTAVGDLDNGKLYALTRTNGNVRERDMVAGQTYPVEFKEIPNAKTLTGAQINTTVNAFNAVSFGRVEDVDYRKSGTGRDVYFVVTGQDENGANADKSRSKYGRIYHLTLDAADPTKGSLEVVLDGDDRTGPGKLLQNPDNIVATANYLYLEEDPNEYGDETHDSYLWQYNLATKELKVVFEIDHHRGAADFAKYNNASGTYVANTVSKMGSWENSGIIDISDVTGKPGTFMLGIQAHGWHALRFKGVDGGALRAAEDQGSQLLILSGLAR
ncbi:MAG: hypothetical protein ABI852_11840 [Gemmatimonadaceae bacterium]